MKQEMSSFFFRRQIPVQNLGGGVRRKILAHNDKMMAVEVSFEKGARGEPHTHPHEQICYVLEGGFEFSSGDETHIVLAGDSLVIPSGTLHGTVCLQTGRLLDVFTPCREDFLQ